MACAGGGATSADVSVELTLESPVAFVREPFEVRIVISNFQECDPFTFPALPDCEVQPLEPPSESRHISIFNGVKREWRSRVHAYELTPLAPGDLKIPPIEIKVDGQSYHTSAQTVTVRPSDADSLLAVKITSDVASVYVGQQIELTLEIWVKPAATRSGPASAMQMWRQVLGRRSAWGPFPIPDRYANRPLNGGADGNYYMYYSQTRYTADRPGRLTFDDVFITMDYPTRFGRDIFNDDVPAAVRRLRTRAQVDPIEVRPLPSEGRPPSFTGAVGRYSVHTSASPTSVRVGDPIELTIDITGEGQLDALPPPTLAQQPALTQGFRVPSEKLAGSTERGQRRFTQVIRPKRPDVTEIPAIEYAYFDPQLGQYVVARSEPISVNVAAAETISSADLTNGTAPVGDRSAAEPVDGLRGIDVDAGRLLASAPGITETHVVAAAAGPPAVFVGTWLALGILQRRSRDSAARRRQAALRNALAELRRARDPQSAAGLSAVQAALAQYLADRTDQPAARFVGAASVDLLRHKSVDPTLVEQWRALIEQCEAAAYGGSAAHNARALAETAEQCLRRLENEAL